MIDVAIIGGGPAGALAAYRLARAGARVAVFDPSHPREKPCGGGVTGRALALVRDVIDVATLPARTIQTARFFDDEGRSAAVTLGTPDPLRGDGLIVAARAEFDGRLLDAAAAAGAHVVAERVTQVDVGISGAVVRTRTGSHHTGWVVGADGANSLVRRTVADALRRDEISVAAGYYADGATSDEIVLEFVNDPPGYIWSFPRPSHLAIGICAPARDATSGALRARTSAWMARRGFARSAQLRAYNWPIPSLPQASLHSPVLAGPRWLLAGDAAGLVDPITREGIFFALQSAAFAATALSARDPAAYYRTLVCAEIVEELRRAARLQAKFFRPGFTRMLVHALTASASIREVMADLVAGRQHYATLKWRLAQTLEVGLAWRWLRGRPAPAGTAP